MKHNLPLKDNEESQERDIKMEQNGFKKYKKGNKNRATVKKDHWNEEKKN